MPRARSHCDVETVALTLTLCRVRLAAPNREILASKGAIAALISAMRHHWSTDDVCSEAACWALKNIATDAGD
jgi:hypothetical protein